MPSSFFSQSSRTSSGTAPAPLAPAAPWQVHLKQELEAVLQRPVDLVRLHERMNPALRQAILQDRVSGDLLCWR